MSAQASTHAVPSPAPVRTSRWQARTACWAAVLTMVAALLAAGICVTAAPPELPTTAAH